MCVTDRQRNGAVARISRGVVAAIGLCGVAMPCMAVDLAQTPPHLWASAAVLSLTLVTAANRPKN
jgi:hypothetical protein